MPAKSNEDQDLTVAVEDDRLVISIGVKALSVVALTGDHFGNHPMDAVTDITGFAEEMKRKLLREEEDGTTLIHRMLDEAAQAVDEDGFEGINGPVDEDDDSEDGDEA